MFADIVSNLASAIIGGLIAGYFSIKATKQMVTREREKSREEEERLEFGLLQALHDEIDTIWERYGTTMASQLEALPDGQPLLFYYPIHQDYFPVYRGNTALVGRIRDNDLRRAVVSVYTKAAGMVDSFRLNNELVAKFEYWNSMFMASQKEPDKKMVTAQYNGLVAYAKSLKTSHNELKKEVSALLRALNKRGVISEKNYDVGQALKPTRA